MTSTQTQTTLDRRPTIAVLDTTVASPVLDRQRAGAASAKLEDFVAVEELFTRFEHYTALAQIALEELQTTLSEMREKATGASEESVSEEPVGEEPVGEVSEPRPSNIVSFPGARR